MEVVLAAHQFFKGVLGTESGFDIFVLPSFYDALGFRLEYQVLDTVYTPFLSWSAFVVSKKREATAALKKLTECAN